LGNRKKKGDSTTSVQQNRNVKRNKGGCLGYSRWLGQPEQGGNPGRKTSSKHILNGKVGHQPAKGRSKRRQRSGRVPDWVVAVKRFGRKKTEKHPRLWPGSSFMEKETEATKKKFYVPRKKVRDESTTFGKKGKEEDRPSGETTLIRATRARLS